MLLWVVMLLLLLLMLHLHLHLLLTGVQGLRVVSIISMEILPGSDFF